MLVLERKIGKHLIVISLVGKINGLLLIDKHLKYYYLLFLYFKNF